jgi:hypothetical protein
MMLLFSQTIGKSPISIEHSENVSLDNLEANNNNNKDK